MDVMRVDSAAGDHRFAMCTACYGYMGDLMATSERLRWLGPSRYNLAGRLRVLGCREDPGTCEGSEDSMGEACL